MLTKLSLWGIYTASYFIDYLVLFGISIWQKANEFKDLEPVPEDGFFRYCSWTDYLIWGVLLGLIIFSVICFRLLKLIPMNTRVKDKPTDSIIWEVAGYSLAQVLTILTILFSDYWVVMSLVIFVVAGVIYVNSKKVHYSPVFLIPMGYSVFQSENSVAITNYSKDGLRLAIESEPDGVEARELAEKVFLIRK